MIAGMVAAVVIVTICNAVGFIASTAGRDYGLWACAAYAFAVGILTGVIW